MAQPVNLAMFIGILFGLVPAMALLYYMLSRYEGYFEDRRVFKWLLIGIGVGSFVTTLEIFLGFASPAFIATAPLQVGLILLAVGYPGIEAAVKTALLNWHSVRTLKDLPFYAVPLGLGFGAANGFILVARGVVGVTGAGLLGELTHLELVYFFGAQFLLFVGGTMIHAFTAAIISAAVTDGMPFRGLFGAALLTGPFYVAFYVFYGPTGGILSFLLPVAVFIYGLVGIRYVTTRILDNVVPPEIARQVRRDIRKKRQGA